MSAINEFVKILKQRDNVSKIGILVGTVISTTPLKIELGVGILVDGENITLSNTFIGLNKHIGDMVIVIANEYNNHFFIIDKVG